MYQPDRGDYRTKETLFSSFTNSCLGRIIILGVILGILSLIAYITCPSEQRLRETMDDNIRQCIENNDTTEMDALDNALANIGYMFSSAEGEPNKELMYAFRNHNRLEFYDHGIYTTLHVFNTYHAEGERCGIGIFGMIIPTLSYHDLLMRIEPVSREYKKEIMKINHEDDTLYFGDTPDLIFRGEFD